MEVLDQCGGRHDRRGLPEAQWSLYILCHDEKQMAGYFGGYYSEINRQLVLASQEHLISQLLHVLVRAYDDTDPRLQEEVLRRTVPLARQIDSQILSTESGRLEVRNGIICDINHLNVSISFSRHLRLPGSDSSSERSNLIKEVWRVDKDEIVSSFVTMRLKEFTCKENDY